MDSTPSIELTDAIIDGTLLSHGSQIGESVAMAQLQSSGEAWRQRWTIDQDTGHLYSTASGHAPMLSPIRIHQDAASGTLTAELGQLAVGSISPAKAEASYLDSLEEIAVWGRLGGGGHDEKQDMKLAREYWKIDELVYKCTKILTQLSNCTMTVESDNDEVTDLVRNWFEKAMPNPFREQWFLEYFRSGMVPVMKALIPYLPREYRSNKIPLPEGGDRVVASTDLMELHKHRENDYLNVRSQYKQAIAQYEKGLVSQDYVAAISRLVVRHQYEWRKGMIPGAYTILDPIAIDIKGPKDFALLQQPFYQVSRELAHAINNPSPHHESIIAALPLEIVDQIRPGVSHVWLSPNICHITFADKQDYERYPTPMLKHAFHALRQKRKLLDADDRTANSVINRILKVTIGSDQWPQFEAEPLRKLAQIFSNPSGTMTIFWNHTLAIEWIEPPLDSFMDPAKYSVCNDMIRTVYGISRIFTGTSESAGAIGNSMMNFKALEEEITTAQGAFMEFLRREIFLLRQALGIASDVHVKFTKINMRDETEFIAVLQSLVQNGILDHQTALETLGYHFPTVVERLKKMKGYRDKDGIFMPTPSANNMGPGAGGGLPTGGKPKKQPLADNNKNKKGKSQPKAAAAIRFMTPTPEDVRLVIDADWIDDDARNQVATAASIKSEWVMTRAEYKEAYDQDVSFIQPWPALNSSEMIAATRDAMRAIASTDVAHEQLLNEWKDSAKAASKGNRGPYVTQQVKDSLRERAVASAMKTCDDKAYNEHIEDRMKEMVSELNHADPTMDPHEVKITASFILERRYRKLLESKTEAA
jgi:hypothetical protein